MGSDNREAVLAGGLAARARPGPAGEVVGVWRDGDAIKCTPAGERLLRVLVVDDNRDAADSLSVLVRLWGHDVRVAYAGEAALQMTSAYQPDVLLLDLAMPEMDGCRVAEHLRRQGRFKDTPLIAVTGYADEANRLRAEAAGFDHYLVKPVEPSTVETLLQLERGRLADGAPDPGATPRSSSTAWIKGLAVGAQIAYDKVVTLHP